MYGHFSVVYMKINGRIVTSKNVKYDLFPPIETLDKFLLAKYFLKNN